MLGTGSKAIGGVKYSIKKLKEASIQIKNKAMGGGITAGARAAARTSGMGSVLLAVLFGLGGLYLLVKGKRK